MSLLIFDTHPLIIDKKLAKIIGLNQALVLQQVHYWLELNKENERNFHEGRYWTYNTIKEWQEEFPFWSKETVKRAFSKLRELGFILVDNFNLYQMDRTLWYSIDYNRLKEYIRSNSPDDDDNIDQMQRDNMTPPLPEITSETTTEISKPSVNQEKQRDRKIDNNYNLKKEYEEIIKRCELYAIDESYREAAAHAIKLLLLDMEKDGRLKIGENYYPIEMVRKDLKKLDFLTVQHGINKFKEASGNYEIRNTVSYLKSCIYNAIHELDIEVDSKLRSRGIINCGRFVYLI